MALLTKEKEEQDYKIYVTDVLMSILRAQFTEPIDIPRYADIKNSQEEEKEPERTADEIIQNISQKLNKLGK